MNLRDNRVWVLIETGSRSRDITILINIFHIETAFEARLTQPFSERPGMLLREI